MRHRVLLTAAVAASAAFITGAYARQTADERIVGHVYRPEARKPGDPPIELRAPAGFRVSVFARHLGKPRMIAVAPSGRVYVTRREAGDVVMLPPDGAGDMRVVAERQDLHGIAIHDGRVYLATVKEILSAPLLDDGGIGELQVIAADLPDGGQHPNRTLAVGPDGLLYASIGSTCNACRETNPEHATIVRMRTDGSDRKVFASGLRNTVGFGWHPGSGALFGMDHGIDWLGNDEPGEELNEIREGDRYGWPYVYGKGRINPQVEPPPGLTKEEWAAQSTGPVLEYTAHSAPMQMVFYDGTQFPGEFQGDAFVALRGSWNRKPPSGYEVVRIRFDDGRPAGIEPFVSGFLRSEGGGHTRLGRPTGLAITRDGSLLVGDDEQGMIYRVSYEGAVGTAGR